MIYQSDDLIGMGDFSAVASKVTDVVGKAGKFIRKLRRKGKKAAKKISSVAAPAPAAAAPAPVPVSAGAGAGIMDFVKKNPLPVAAGVLVAVLLFARKRG